MPRIFTTNSQLTEEDHILPRRRNAKQQHAIDRRYRKIGPLTEPLQRLGRTLKTGRAHSEEDGEGSAWARDQRRQRCQAACCAPLPGCSPPPLRKRQVIVDSDED